MLAEKRVHKRFVDYCNNRSVTLLKGLRLFGIRCKQKNSPNAFRIRIFLFRSYSFGIETINTSIHVRSRSSLENHTRFQTKMCKVFLDQKGPKTLPFGRHIPYMAYIWECPPDPEPFHDC